MLPPPLYADETPPMANGGVSMRDNQSFFKLICPARPHSTSLSALARFSSPLSLHPSACPPNRLVKQTPKVLQLYYAVFAWLPLYHSLPLSLSYSLPISLCLRILNRTAHCRQRWRRSVSR